MLRYCLVGVLGRGLEPSARGVCINSAQGTLSHSSPSKTGLSSPNQMSRHNSVPTSITAPVRAPIDPSSPPSSGSHAPDQTRLHPPKPPDPNPSIVSREVSASRLRHTLTMARDKVTGSANESHDTGPSIVEEDIADYAMDDVTEGHQSGVIQHSSSLVSHEETLMEE